jgi:hypothetical protein
MNYAFSENVLLLLDGVDFCFNLPHFVELKILDRLSTLLEQLDKLLVIVGKYDVGYPVFALAISVSDLVSFLRFLLF